MVCYRRKKGTKTSSFGSPGRINHDSTTFYSSRLYEGLPKEKKVDYEESKIPKEYLNKIFIKSSECMNELPDNSVHLMVTSPPYNLQLLGELGCQQKIQRFVIFMSISWYFPKVLFLEEILEGKVLFRRRNF